MPSTEILNREQSISAGRREDEASLLLAVAVAVRKTRYRFTTITPATHAFVNARPWNAQARNLEDVLGWSRPFKENILPPGLFEKMTKALLLENDGNYWRSKVRFATLREELYLHSAFPTTAKDSVFFGPDTYKFVDAIHDHLYRRSTPVRRAADLCAGAGPGGIEIAKAFPHAEVFLLDINPKAVAYAAANAALAGVSNAKVRHSDLLSAVDGAFDIIVAHPPYLVDRDGRAYRHGGENMGAELALKIVKASLERLAQAGTLLLFTGVAMDGRHDPFFSGVAKIVDERRHSVSYREVDPDVFGEELANETYRNTDRIALAVLTVTRAKR